MKIKLGCISFIAMFRADRELARRKRRDKTFLSAIALIKKMPMDDIRVIANYIKTHHVEMLKIGTVAKSRYRCHLLKTIEESRKG